jgi:hypothetical protein
MEGANAAATLVLIISCTVEFGDPEGNLAKLDDVSTFSQKCHNNGVLRNPPSQTSCFALSGDDQLMVSCF